MLSKQVNNMEVHLVKRAKKQTKTKTKNHSIIELKSISLLSTNTTQLFRNLLVPVVFTALLNEKEGL